MSNDKTTNNSLSDWARIIVRDKSLAAPQPVNVPSSSEKSQPTAVALPTRANGKIRLISCRVDTSPTSIGFDIIVEDAEGRLWKTEHDVFRFEMEPFNV